MLPGVVREELERIVRSSSFAKAAQLRRLLSWLVQESLEGRTGALREHDLGVAVFERGAGYEPKADAVVRLEARRLRAKLLEYYAGEGAQDPIVIQVPKGRYVPVFQAREPAAANAAPAKPHPPGKRWWVWLAAGIAAASLIGGAVRLIWFPSRVASVAVLPFLNLTGDPGNEYLCDGLAEELTDTLARVPELRVVARTSTFRFKGKAQDVRGIGAQLGVANVVEGSVLRVGDHVRVTLQMSRTSDGYHVLSRSFDGRLLELTGMQTDLAVPLIAVLRPGAAAPQRRKPVPEAHDLLLKAAAWRGDSGLEAYQKSLAYLEQAVQIDPAYADAYGALASRYVTTGANFEAAPLEPIRVGKAAAARALELDPDCAAAYGAMGYADALYLLDWKLGEDELRHALRLQPGSGEFYHWLGNVLMYQGRFDEALVQFRTAARLDPLSPQSGLSEGIVLFYARRYDAALDRFLLAQRSHPEYIMVHWWIGLMWLARHADDKAAQEFRLLPAAVAEFGNLGVLVHQGRRAEMETLMNKMEHPAPGQGAPRAFNLACIHAGLGDRDAAFKWLEQAYQDRKITQLKVEPLLDSIRGDPRYLVLLRKTGLAR